MIYAYDTEFIEHFIRTRPFGRTVHTIELISIGIVCEDGREYYAVNENMPAPAIRKEPWLMANVIPNLPRAYGDWRNRMPESWLFNWDDRAVKPHARIADGVREFLLADDGAPELWADYGAYDHVALCQLWGRMIDLPDGMPMFTRDLQQEAARTGAALPEQASGAHNALEDARHVMHCLRHLGIAATRA